MLASLCALHTNGCTLNLTVMILSFVVRGPTLVVFSQSLDLFVYLRGVLMGKSRASELAEFAMLCVRTYISESVLFLFDEAQACFNKALHPLYNDNENNEDPRGGKVSLLKPFMDVFSPVVRCVLLAGTRFDFEHLARLGSATASTDKSIVVRIWSSFQWNTEAEVKASLARVLDISNKTLLDSLAHLLQGRSRFWIRCITTAYDDVSDEDTLYSQVTAEIVRSLVGELDHVVKSNPASLSEILRYYLGQFPRGRCDKLGVPAPPVLEHAGIFFCPANRTALTTLKPEELKDNKWFQKLVVRHDTTHTCAHAHPDSH